VPDRRKHRGPHPEDGRLFAPEVWPVLRRAVAELCWLLSRDYPQKSALKLVGDRYALVARQRTAVERCACSETAAGERRRRQVGPSEVRGRPLWIDGYNVLTTIEAALAGAVLLPGCDGTYRDMASMHGSFRKVTETLPALELVGRVIAALAPGRCVWYLDRPVSNSGRLKTLMGQLAAENGWPWAVELVPDPDHVLADPSAATGETASARVIVATADSVILDRCGAWFNLARETVFRHIPEARVVEMAADTATDC